MKTYTHANYIFIGFFAGILALVAYATPAYAQTTTATIPLCELSRSLSTGMEGEDVRCLQRYLNWSGYTVAASGVGSPGNETAYFGPLTANAVARWQNASASQVLIPLGLSAGTGYWGSSSFSWYVQIVRTALGTS